MVKLTNKYLYNNINISIQFLGVGNSFSKKFGNTSAIIEVGNKRLLVDAGRTTPNDLDKAGLTWNDIDAIFITHLHGDNVYGIENAGLMGQKIFNKKPHIIFPCKKMKNELWEKVLKGTMGIDDSGKTMKFEDYYTYEIVSEKEQYFMFGDVMFSVYRTKHVRNKKSYGLIIGEYDFVVFTSDSLMDKDFLEIAFHENCQAVFHDCFLANDKQKTHASLSDFEQINEKHRHKIYIMHYSDSLAEYYPKIKEIGLNIASTTNVYSFTVKQLAGVGAGNMSKNAVSYDGRSFWL